MDLPKTIRAVYQESPGSSTLFLTETPLPVPAGPDEHLIKIKSTAPCLGELAWEINFPHLFPPPRERVPGTEGAGVVVSSPGPDSSPFRPGDEVFFRLPANRPGCLREYTVALTAELARKPRGMSWVQAGAAALSSLTAYQGLFRHGLLDPAALRGDPAARESNRRRRILVTGAGGGVGSWAVQLAAAAGAGTVVAVCGPSKAADVLRAGATEVCDYTRQSVAEWAAATDADAPSRVCDMALDCIGGSSLEGCWSAVRDGGVIVSAAETPDSRRPEAARDKKMERSAWFLMEPSGADLEDVARVFEAGKAAPWIDSVFEFEQFAEAYERVKSGKSKGKVVIKVDC
ncbi:Reticulon-4-interacting protein 1 [Escovopsis weberi]|uniref:Reticulon-4-interacting protein 1 n=1 Tax=Escovopsis weberi TaxID=150374 RepID=A0A0N0RU82_ESCWE|nr:Reticulon-4-interacting protein 1 [Escovopsis weberi]